MLIDFLKNKALKQQNRLGREWAQLNLRLARETDPDKARKLTRRMAQIRLNLRAIRHQLIRLANQRDAKILAKEEKRRLDESKVSAKPE